MFSHVHWQWWRIKIQKYDGINQADQPAGDCSKRRIALVEEIQLYKPVREGA